jgi:hypothetical protein
MKTFRSMGEAAGAAKWPLAFKIPMQSATRETKKMYGKTIRFRDTANSNFPGIVRKPGAKRVMIQGERMTPRRVTIARTIVKRVKTMWTTRSASLGSRFSRESTYTGRKEAVRAPSATIRRSMFGIRKATKKASAWAAAPKEKATTISRTSPRILLKKVKKATVPAGRAIVLWSDIPPPSLGPLTNLHAISYY